MSEKIKLSDIRAQYPMYADVPDDQFLIGLHKKLYADIAPAKFYGQIEYDTQKADPTEGMSGFDKFAAGVGGGLTSLAQGAGQMLGLSSRADVAEKRKLDAPLNATGAGTAGNIVGNVAAMLPAMFIPGVNTMAGAAALGGATGLLAPSVSTEETLKNAALGGASGPAALALGRGVAAGYQGLKGLFQPLTNKGQEGIAASTLQSFASDPQKAAAALRNAREIVPGSAPTIGQASGDAGLSQLERTLQNNPETGKLLAERYASQRGARIKAVQNVAGTDEHYNAIKAGRDLFAKEDYSNAMAQGIDPAAAESLAPQIGLLMERPSIQAAKREALKLAKETNTNISDFGSIEGLDWLKKGLDNAISKQTGVTNSAGKQGLKAMLQTKDDLMSVIEQVAPAYKVANDNYAGMSRQINGMDVARGLLDRLQPALSRYGAGPREMKDAYATALEGATESVKKSTGINKALSDVLPTQDIFALENVARDMGRQANLESGKAIGSNTAQNLSAQNLLRRALGPAGLPQSWAESTALQTLLAPVTGAYKLGGAEQKILDKLAQVAMDPQESARLLTLAQQVPKTSRLAREIERLLPGQAAGGLLSYRQQQ